MHARTTPPLGPTCLASKSTAKAHKYLVFVPAACPCFARSVTVYLVRVQGRLVTLDTLDVVFIKP